MSYAAPVSALIRTYGCRVKKKRKKRKKGSSKDKKTGLSTSKMHQEICVFFSKQFRNSSEQIASDCAAAGEASRYVRVHLPLSPYYFF